MTNDAEKQTILARLALLSAGLTHKELARLVELSGDAAELLQADAEWFLEAGIPGEKGMKAQSEACLAAAEKEIKLAEKHGIRILVPESDAYPDELRLIHDNPPVLYVQGELKSGERRLAMVGTRKPSPQGERHARLFARDLARAGACIVSGLALGIDAAAHEGALDGEGRTIAVLGSGLLRIYPENHHRLARRIAGCGALVSEFPLEKEPEHWHFPMRNRIISGLSSAVLVVEAPLKSGALITADQALEQGKDVFAIPGAIHTKFSRGTNALIRQGAACITEPADVLFELGWGGAAAGKPKPERASSDDPVIKALENGEAMTFEEIAFQTGIEAGELLGRLSALEAGGALRQIAGGRFTIREFF